MGVDFWHLNRSQVPRAPLTDRGQSRAEAEACLDHVGPAACAELLSSRLTPPAPGERELPGIYFLKRNAVQRKLKGFLFFT